MICKGSIEFHGDSTQVGSTPAGGGTYVQTKVPPSVYIQMMADYFNKRDANLIKNYGIGGSTAREALTVNALTQKKLYGAGTLNFAQHIAQSSAKYIICNWGINDCFMPGNTPDTFVADYAALKNIVMGAEKVFIAQTSNPLTMPGASGSDRNEICKQYANALLAAGPMLGFEVMDTFHAIHDWFPSYAKHLADGVHPDSILYKYIGEYGYRFLNERNYLINKPAGL